MRCAYLLAILAAFAVTTSCKPRNDASQALADKGDAVTIDRSSIRTIVEEGTRAKTDMDDLGSTARSKGKNFPYNARVYARDTISIAVKTAQQGKSLLEMAKRFGPDTTTTANAPAEEVDRLISGYEQIQVLLKPLDSDRFWENWTEKKAEEVGTRTDGASAGFGKIAGVANRWIPKDPPTAARPLGELPATVVKPAAEIDQSSTSTTPDFSGTPVASGEVGNGQSGRELGEPAVFPTVTPKQEPKKEKNSVPPSPVGNPNVPPSPVGASVVETVVVIPAKEPEPVRDLWLEAKLRAERLESDLLAGRFSGRVPTMNELRRAIDAARRSDSRDCNDNRPRNDSQCQGREIIELYSGVDQLRELYGEDAGVDEKYSVRQHTERVLFYYFALSEGFGVPKSSNDYDYLIPAMVALHDIGKPVAVRAGNKDKQHEHNEEIVGAVLRKIGFSATQVRIAKTMAGNDVLGYIVRNGVGAKNAKELFQTYADAAGLSTKEFFSILRPFYLSDANSYPHVRRDYFYKDPSANKLYSNNGALENLAKEIDPPPVVEKPKPAEKPVAATPPAPAAATAIPPHPSGPGPGEPTGPTAGGPFQGGGGAPGWSGSTPKASPVSPEKPAQLAPKMFITAKYANYKHAISFHENREAHMYPDASSDKWVDAKWELDKDNKVIYVRAPDGQNWVFDVGNPAEIMLIDGNNHYAFNRIRAPK